MIPEFIEKISNILKDFKNLQIKPIDMPPLFLQVITYPEIAVFATFNGQPNKTYEEALRKFQELYSKYPIEWLDYDLSLVLCIPPNQFSIPEDLRIKIVQDGYFCRKFVIDFNEDIEKQLASLPFLPLRFEKIFKKPLSAQTFLMEHGLNTKLAQYLSIPHRRRASKILEECLNGSLGNPNWEKQKVKILNNVPFSSSHLTSVRLKKLIISNFRAYTKQHVCDLDADLIILYGRNGLGKTSFFDAIEFACTGRVANLERKTKGDIRRLKKVLKYWDCRDFKDVYVILEGIKKNESFKIERNLGEENFGSLNGVKKERKEILSYLTDCNLSDLRIERFVHLFRATHFFGQEYQPLTENVHKESVIPGEEISRMLAIQEYEEVIKKTEEILNIIKKEKTNLTKEKQIYMQYINKIQMEIEKLESSLKTCVSSEKFRHIKEYLTEQITKKLSFKELILEDKNILQEIRAKIKSIVDEKERKRKIAIELNNKIIYLSSIIQEIENYKLELKESKSILESLEKKLSKKEKELHTLKNEIESKLKEKLVLKAKYQNLNWIFNNRDKYFQLQSQIKLKNETIEKLNENYRNIEITIWEKEEQINEIIKKIDNLQSKLNKLSILLGDIFNCKKYISQIAELQNQLSEIELIKKDVRKELNNKKESFNAIKHKYHLYEREVLQLQKYQTELKNLLDNVERYITSNVCPVCGSIHKTREELLKKLQLQKGIQSKELKNALQNFNEYKKSKENLEAEIWELEEMYKQILEKEANIKSQINFINQDINNIYEKATSIELKMENISDLTTLEQQILAKYSHIEDQINFLKKTLTTYKKEKEKLLTKQENVHKEVKKEMKEKIELENMYNNLKNESLSRQVSFELCKEDIQKSLEKITKQIIDLNNDIKNLQKMYDLKKEKIQCLYNEKQALKDKIEFLYSQITEKQEDIYKIEILGKQIDVNVYQITSRHLNNLLKQIENEIVDFKKLYEKILDFEIILDTSQKSALLEKFINEQENFKRELEKIKTKESDLERWNDFFLKIQEKIRDTKFEIINNYIKDYGPLASVIQSRLRPIYGIKGIELEPQKKEGSILVKANRKNGETLYPSEYFSASQLQIIALSLFLSASIIQTWSAFSPILLDDPVIHFDDLNAYAFLDLIKGIFICLPEKQFIISTCEERLFKLMRQKFDSQKMEKLNKKVKFYILNPSDEKRLVEAS